MFSVLTGTGPRLFLTAVKRLTNSMNKCFGRATVLSPAARFDGSFVLCESEVRCTDLTRDSAQASFCPSGVRIIESVWTECMDRVYGQSVLLSANSPEDVLACVRKDEVELSQLESFAALFLAPNPQN